MKTIKKIMVFFALFCAAGFSLSYDPAVGLAVSSITAIITGFAIFKPLPSIGLGSRVFSAVVFSMVGMIGIQASLGAIATERQEILAELKQSDPVAYLAELETSDPDKWFSELSVMDPDRYQKEKAQRAQAVADEVARKAQMEVERAKREMAKRAAKEAHECSDAFNTQAYIYSQFFVERELRAPSTAEFPSIHRGDGVSSSALGNCEFLVRAYVDAQNTFGANIRTRYAIQIKRLPQSDSWQLISMKFEQ